MPIIMKGRKDILSQKEQNPDPKVNLYRWSYSIRELVCNYVYHYPSVMLVLLTFVHNSYKYTSLISSKLKLASGPNLLLAMI